MQPYIVEPFAFVPWYHHGHCLFILSMHVFLYFSTCPSCGCISICEKFIAGQKNIACWPFDLRGMYYCIYILRQWSVMTHLMNVYVSSFKSVYLQIYKFIKVWVAAIHLHCVNNWWTIHVMSRYMKRKTIFKFSLIFMLYLETILCISPTAMINWVGNKSDPSSQLCP